MALQRCVDIHALKGKTLFFHNILWVSYLTPIAGWSREFVRPAARLRNGLRLQADRRPAQMRPAREARSYKKCRRNRN